MLGMNFCAVLLQFSYIYPPSKIAISQSNRSCNDLAWDDLTTLLVWVNKENSIEFSFNFCTLLIHLLHSLYTTFPHLLCNSLCDITLTCDTWHIIWYFPILLSCIVSPNIKRKKNINNNLAILPSHNRPRVENFVKLSSINVFWYSRIFMVEFYYEVQYRNFKSELLEIMFSIITLSLNKVLETSLVPMTV